MTNDIDEVDRTILMALQDNVRTGIEALAAETGLSAASVQRRIRALKDRHVITDEVAVVDPASVGQSMTFVVMAEMRVDEADKIDAFARRAQAEPQVQQVYYITGDADFCLICTASSIEDFEAFTRRLFYKGSNVSRFRTSVVMSRRKTGMKVHIAPS